MASVVTNVVVMEVVVVVVLVMALEQIHSRAPSCVLLLFLLHPPVSFSFLSSFEALASSVPHTYLCYFLTIFLLSWILLHFFHTVHTSKFF